MEAVVDNEIRIPMQALDEDLLADLHGLIYLPNEEKIAARKRKAYGWAEMGDEISLWYEEDGAMVLPRGLRHPLEEGFRELGDPIVWDDRRTDDPVMQVWPQFPHYRSFQEAAADRLVRTGEGIIEAPAGAGKSVTGLEVVRRARQRRSIVVVNTINIATQWLDEARDFLGEDYGLGIIGEGRWEESRLTFATMQTLYSRRDQLWRDGWFDRFGVAILDECHHQQARTFVEVFSRFSARVRGGLSATPDKTGQFEVVQAVLGDVVHRTTRHQLRDEGILVRPTIQVVETDYSFPYWGDHHASKKTGYVCDKPGCRLSGKTAHGHRNNYTKMVQDLVRDERRNNLIAARIAAERGSRQLVVSPQSGHLGNISAVLRAHYPFPGEVFMLTGKESDARRQEVVRAVRDTPDCVVFSTIADEALNIPPLRVLHMPFPTANLGSIRQRVGRVERATPGKDSARVYDYRDGGVGVLARQYGKRRWEAYAPEMYQINHDGQEHA